MFNKILKKNSTEEEWCKKTKINTFKKGIDEFKRLLKNHKKRILALMLALITFGSTMTSGISAFALTIGSTYSVTKTYVSGVNYDFNQSGLRDQYGNSCSRYGQFNVLKVSSSNEILYCLEPFVDIDSTSGLKGLDFDDTTAWNKLSYDQQGMLALATLYGRVGTDAGNNYLAERAATQIIIWDIVLGERTDYSSKATRPRWITSWTTAVQNAHKAILTDMETHSKYPKFNKTDITLKGVGNAQTITDKNGVLSEYEVESNSDLNLSKSGNDLIISAKKAGNYSSTITLNKKKPTGTGSSPLALRCGSEQTLLYGKVYDPMSVNISVTVEAQPTGKIKVIKTDEKGNQLKGDALKNAEFKLYEWNDTTKKWKTTAKETLTLSGDTFVSSTLKWTESNNGWFRVVETNAPIGYFKIKDNALNTASTQDAKNHFSGCAASSYSGAIQIANNGSSDTQQFTIKVKNDPITGTVNVVKYYSDTADSFGAGTGKKRINNVDILKSLDFVVRQYSASQHKYVDTDGMGIVRKLVTTDADGNAVNPYYQFTGLTYTADNQGYFKVFENGTNPIAVNTDNKKVIYEYGKNCVRSTTEGSFRITQYTNTTTGEVTNVTTSGKTYSIYMTDELQYGTVKVKKTADNPKDAEGIEFTLKGKADITKTYTATATTIWDANENAAYAVFENVPVGQHYTLTENMTGHISDVYVAQKPIKDVVVDWNKTTDQDVHNNSKIANLTLIKTSEDGKVANVQFKLTGESKLGVLIEAYATTDKNGKAVFKSCKVLNTNFDKTEYDNGVLIGDHYTVEELNVPEWYVQPEKLTDVKIEYGKTNQVTFTNTLKRGNLDVQKVIENYPENTNASLEGFVFTLSGTSWSGEPISIDATTDKNGVAHFKDVLISDPSKGYNLHETAYPAWYTPEGDKTVYVTYNETNTAVIYSYTNAPTRGSLEVQKVIENIPENAATPITDFSGFEFTLSGTSDSGDKVKMSLTTGKDGKVNFNDVLIGTYKLTETNYPSWYNPQYPDGLTVRIDHNNGNLIKVSFDNYFKRGSLEIQKEIKNIPDYVSVNLAGFEFTLTGTSDSGNSIKLTATTDADGKVRFNDVLIGDYTITESKYPKWYTPQYPDGLEVRIDETRNPIKVTFENYPKLGDLVVVKAAEDGIKQGFKFRLHGISDSGDYVDITLATNAEGWVVFNNIPIGNYTIEEVETSVKYVQPEGQEVTINWNGRTELWTDKDAFSTDGLSVAHFDNTLKKFRVEVTKSDSEKAYAQGDATLEGAEYGIFKGNELIDTYTTDAEGNFLTNYYICDNDWTIKEITPSEGYLLDNTVYKVGSEPELYEIELNNAPEIESLENIIKGDIAILKHSDNGDTQIETPEVGATFEVYLKSAGSYENADPDERDILICDENGFAQTKLLPYGVYTIHQTKGFFEAEMMPDFDVFIKNNGATKHFIINNKPFESHIKVEKKDAETHKNIPYAGAGFQIYDPDGNLVRLKLTYPTPTFIDTFYTDGNGEFTTPEKLPAGEGYKLVEVEAPYGYVLDSTPVEFDITRDNSASDFFDLITVIKLNKYDVPQKGILTIYKEGEVFSSVKEKDNVFTPVFANKYLSNAVYEIFAAEDIITPDETVRYNKGDLVDTVKTDKNGIAESKELYLGKYKVVEKTAPDTFSVDNKEYDVEFTYQGQEIKITREDMNLFDERQKVEISLGKVLEKNETYHIGDNDEILNVEFGVFANENIEADDGSVIPKNGLICSAHCDENGKITFPCDLPIGYKFYVQEIATDEHYQLDDTKYKFNTNYAGQDVDVIHIDINNGDPIENTLIAGNIEITKSNDAGKLIEGVKFGIFANDCEEFLEKKALFVGLTNEKGKLVFDNVPYGDYQIVELEAAINYIPNTEPISVSNKTGGETVKIDVVNKEVKGFISVTKTGEVFYSVSDNEDATKNFIYKTENLKDAEFDIIASENIYSYERLEGVLRYKEGEVVQTLKTDENGLAKSDELYLGKYKVVEKTATDGFKINNNVFEISLDFDNRTNDIVYSDLTVDNTRQKAAISLTKEMEKDEVFGLGDKNEIENVVFGLFSDEEMTAYDGTVIPKDTILSMAKTDKDGYLEFDIDIPYGYKYYVQEIATDNHYSLSDEQFKFDFSTKDRDILGLEFSINDGKVITNYLKRGTIDINKFGEINASDDTIPLSDTVFGLFYTDCTEFTEENAILTVTTNENGYAKFEFVDYGEYLVKEIQSHKGYVVSDEIFTVNIGEDDQNEVINVLNDIIRGNVTVQKVDADYTDRNLEGAVFNLYTDVDNNGVYDENIDTLYGVLDDLSDGLYEISDVPYGHYLLHEETAPHGFTADKNYYPVFVCENKVSYDLTNNGEFFINNAETGELKIIKTSSDEIVKGFEFLIEGMSEAGTEVSITAKTDKDGIIHIPVIRTGTYTISEINLDERYVVPEPQVITITNNETAEVNFFNKVITGTIEITKTDFVTGDTLPNTIIEILDKDGNVIRSGETDENGIITFEELPYGTYFYKESRAPKGYLIDETPHEFSITEDGQIIKAVMTNQAIEKTPNTGTNIVYVAGAAVALSAVLGILLITYKRKKDTVTE